MKILPIFVTIFVALMFFKLIKQSRDKKISFSTLLAWSLVWLAVLAVFWQPDLASRLALIFGIQRGADLVIYVAIIIILYLLYKTSLRLNRVDEALTKVIREDAITHAQDKRPR